MLCKKCGTDNPINRLYCDNCGAEIQHDLEEIKAAVDREIKSDKAKATSISIRWLLGLSFVLFVIGSLFRSAYKDLPANDIVPLIAAPPVELTEPPTITTTQFGLEVPNPRATPISKASLPPAKFRAQVTDDAYRRAAVVVNTKTGKEPLAGLIVTDLLLHFTPSGEAAPIPIHAADIAALRPTGGGLWHLTARSQPKTLTGAFADAAAIDLHILRSPADKKPAPDTVPLRNVIEIKPLEGEKP
ncbi:MAG: zinc ribbon domain-containing protein [Planctomycetes bacterium]|nr:zinc ribbon domain-containing protein [Planctomycetota bacterium]